MTSPYACNACGHPFYEHRESAEWQLLNPRRKRNLHGCTRATCSCEHADDSHIHPSDRCELCGERFSERDERAEMFDPHNEQLPSLVVHADCGVSEGMEVA